MDLRRNGIGLSWRTVAAILLVITLGFFVFKSPNVSKHDGGVDGRNRTIQPAEVYETAEDSIPVRGKYLKGRSCLDGTKVQTEAQVRKGGIHNFDRLRENNRKLNNVAQVEYGRFCATGKCKFFYRQIAFICISRSATIQPWPYLLPALITTCIWNFANH